eukprot:12880850-Prorocentrum_lima.AAC.1
MPEQHTIQIQQHIAQLQQQFLQQQETLNRQATTLQTTQQENLIVQQQMQRQDFSQVAAQLQGVATAI